MMLITPIQELNCKSKLLKTKKNQICRLYYQGDWQTKANTQCPIFHNVTQSHPPPPPYHSTILLVCSCCLLVVCVSVPWQHDFWGLKMSTLYTHYSKPIFLINTPETSWILCNFDTDWAVMMTDCGTPCMKLENETDFFYCCHEFCQWFMVAVFQ